MAIGYIALVVIYIFVCFFLILVVLLQPGKGMDFSAFGGGASQTFFGARGATSLFVKLTVGAAALFLITSFSLGLMSSGRTRSVLDKAEEPASTEAPATPGEQEANPSETPAPPAENAAPQETPAESGDAKP